MSFFTKENVANFTAGADLSGHRYRVVKGTANDLEVDAATDDTAPIVGVVMEPPNGTATGLPLMVQTGGIAKCECNGAVTRYTYVTGAALGKIADYAAPGAATTSFYVGIALEDGAAGDIISVLVTPGVNTGT